MGKSRPSQSERSDRVPKESIRMEPRVQRRHIGSGQTKGITRIGVRNTHLTNEHIDGIRLEPRQKFALEVDALEVHVDSAENIKSIGGHDLLGGGWRMGLLDWWVVRGMRGKVLEAGTGQSGAWLKDTGRTRRKH